MNADKIFTTTQIDNILIYLEAFQSKDFVFVHKVEPTQDPDGYWVVGYDSLSPLTLNFVKSACDNGWILDHFDWPSYCKSNEYAASIFDNGLIDASVEQVALILTTIIRRDRFAPGWLNSAYKDGLLIRILKRLQTIRNDYRS